MQVEVIVYNISFNWHVIMVSLGTLVKLNQYEKSR